MLFRSYADLQLAQMPDTGDLAADLHTWMRSMIAEGARAEHTSMARSLMAAGLEGLPSTEVLLQQNQLWDSGPLVSRLRAAAERGEIRPDAHLPAVTSALTDPLIFHIVTGSPRTEQWGAGLVELVLRGILPAEPPGAEGRCADSAPPGQHR